MNSMSRREFLGVAAGALAMAGAGEAHAAAARPAIMKRGTIDLDLVETSPVVFRNKLFRFEYVRQGYWNNKTGDSHFRFVEQSGDAGPAFAKGFHLGSAAVFDDMAVVTCVNIWDGERVEIFASRDLESWQQWNALDLKGYGMFNTSLCRSGDEYVLMFEVGKPPEIAGKPFTARFAKSRDLHAWELTPPECNYSKDRYTAPHGLRYLDGWFYNFYLEAVKGGYEQYVVRSKDLVKWELSPLNPVLAASPEDKQIVNQTLTEEQREKIKNARNINNSDIDFCEFEGKTVINYSWGNQQGTEFLAEAVYNGSQAKFLRGWFPEATT